MKAAAMILLLVCQVLFTGATGRVTGSYHARSVLANNPVAAGASCKVNDICAHAAPNDDNFGDLCPVNTTTQVGICPDARAGDSCNSGDLCATSATTSAPCAKLTDSRSQDVNAGTYTNDEGYGCPEFPAGASCSQFTGSCGPTQVCNAPITDDIESERQLTTLVGTCVTPVAAGSKCVVGYDTCSGAATFTDAFCTSTPCPLVRPGGWCESNDECSNGGDGSTICGSSGSCPAVATDGQCLAGDACTSPQLCKVSDSGAGQCVNTVSAGAPCNLGQDMCLTDVNTLSGELCPGSQCPKVSAGSTCQYHDPCSDGTAQGTPCSATAAAPTASCPALPADSACYAGDECSSKAAGQPQSCNAVGSSAGTCVVQVSAGQSCTASQDVCSPWGIICPSSNICPKADAGAPCYSGDVCNSGSSKGSACPADNAQSSQYEQCPKLPTGVACTASDLCVFGANCLGAKDDGSASGVCTPFVKVSSVTAPSTTSKAAMVPAVTSVATLSMYSNAAAFNTSEHARFIQVLETNIRAKINALVSVTINKVTSGSAIVENSVAFTSSDSTAAEAGKTALYQTLSSGDTSIFGATFGSVAVSSVTQGTTANPTLASGAASVGCAWGVLGTAAVAVAVLFSV